MNGVCCTHPHFQTGRNVAYNILCQRREEGLWVFRMKLALVQVTIATRIAALMLALALTAISVGGARAQSYPDKPVRIIVPFAAGGLADITARLVAEKLSDKLGQRFVVENQPGAGGIAAARSTIAGGADGYTLTLLTNSTAISVSLFKHLPYDPVKDFAPISAIGDFPCVFVVGASSPFHTLDDMLKAAREKPGTLNVGTINVGSTQNLAAELFKSRSGANVVIVPFRSTPDEIVGVLRNDIQVSIDFYPALIPTLADGKVRAIATTAAQRIAALSNVPTVQESGFADFDVASWNALFAPAGTPAPIIDKLNHALREVVADPDFRKRAHDLGIEAEASSPAEVDARMRSDVDKWAKVIDAANIPKQ